METQAYTVALYIGGGIVAWCALMIVLLLQRVTRVETTLAAHMRRCPVGEGERKK